MELGKHIPEIESVLETSKSTEIQHFVQEIKFFQSGEETSPRINRSLSTTLAE
jgi:hypothetical protein